MAVCPACGAQSTGDERSCTTCGALLQPLGQRPGHERKLVAIVICDLVKPAMGEAWDAEDVDFLRRRFAAMARDVVASFGGVTEMRAGDAVLAVFGLPTARDDDTERAVRAAFSLLDEVRTLRWPDARAVQASAAVDTGEAYLRPDVDPSSGQPLLAGDVVNATARLLALAPVGAVWVAGPAHDLTKHVVRYQSVRSLDLRGNSNAVEAWRATGVSGVSGERQVRALPPGPFVGRRAELDTLQAILDDALVEHRSRLALVVGEPGMGKTRLLNEFGARVTSAAGADDAARGVRWLRGRCRPFGDHVTLAAVGDLVRLHACIAGDDDAATVQTKLEASVPDGPDAGWIRARLRPLVGLPGGAAGREENFAAWRAHLLDMVDGGRLVLVIEDLHWADGTTLAFLDALVAEPLHAPVTIIASTGPELLARDDVALAGRADVERVHLPPLSGAEVEQLVVALLGHEPSGSLEAVVRQAAGNPLYAEAYARLLVDRGLLVRTGKGLALADELVPPPATIQAVLTARLDTLAPAQKALLQDAAVFGETFWRGGLADLSQRSDNELDRMLGQLAERQLVRPQGTSGLEGEPEYVFCHMLAGDVAYSQLPPIEQARRHRAAAAWLERAAGGRVEDHVEMLAHHWATACGLARAAGDEELAAATLSPALDSLQSAGRRCMALDMAGAARHFRRGLDLAPPGHVSRSRLLAGLGVALAGMSRHREAAEVLRDAASAATAAGETRTAAVAGAFLSGTLAFLRDEGRHRAMLEAGALAVEEEPSPEKAQVLWMYAGYLCDVLAEWQPAQEAADAALVTAEELGAPPPMDALGYRGLARCRLGDPAGRSDIERSLEVGGDAGYGDRVVIEREHGLSLHWTEGPVAALRRSGETMGAAMRRGVSAEALSLRGDRVAFLSALGEWEAALEQASELSAELEAGGNRRDLIPVRMQQALLLARRGEAEAAAPLAAWLYDVGASMPVQPMRSYGLLGAAVVHGFAGETDVTDELVTEWVRGWTGNDPCHAELLPDAVRLARGSDDPRWLGEPLGAVLRDLPVYGLVLDTIEAVRIERAGRPEAALRRYSGLTERWRVFGVPYEEGHALLGAARCLVTLDRALQAAPLLEHASELFAWLGARPALAEVAALSAVGPVAAWRARPAP